MTLTQKDQTSDTYYPLKQEELVLIIQAGIRWQQKLHLPANH